MKDNNQQEPSQTQSKIFQKDQNQQQNQQPYNPFNPVGSFIRNNPSYKLKSEPGSKDEIEKNISYFFHQNRPLTGQEMKYKQLIRTSSQAGLRDDHDFQQYSNAVQNFIYDSKDKLQDFKTKQNNINKSLKTDIYKHAKSNPHLFQSNKNDQIDFLIKLAEQQQDHEQLKKFFEQQIHVAKLKNLVQKYKNNKCVRHLNKVITDIKYTLTGENGVKPLKYIINKDKMPESLDIPMMIPVQRTIQKKPKPQKFDYTQIMKQKLYLFPDKDNFEEFFKENQLNYKAPLLQEQANGQIRLQKEIDKEKKQLFDKLGFRIRRLEKSPKKQTQPPENQDQNPLNKKQQQKSSQQQQQQNKLHQSQQKLQSQQIYVTPQKNTILLKTPTAKDIKNQKILIENIIQQAEQDIEISALEQNFEKTEQNNQTLTNDEHFLAYRSSKSVKQQILEKQKSNKIQIRLKDTQKINDSFLSNSREELAQNLSISNQQLAMTSNINMSTQQSVPNKAKYLNQQIVRDSQQKFNNFFTDVVSYENEKQKENNDFNAKLNVMNNQHNKLDERYEDTHPILKLNKEIVQDLRIQ